MGRRFEGKFDAGGKKIAIVASRFNDFFTSELLDGALDCLRRHGVADEAHRHGLGARRFRDSAGRQALGARPVATPR